MCQYMCGLPVMCQVNSKIFDFLFPLARNSFVFGLIFVTLFTSRDILLELLVCTNINNNNRIFAGT